MSNGNAGETVEISKTDINALLSGSGSATANVGIGKNTADVPGNHRLIPLEQFDHLSLRQPDGFVFKTSGAIAAQITHAHVAR